MSNDESPNVTLTRVIVEAIDAALAELHTGLPARVIAYDSARGMCTAQPLLQRVCIDPNTEQPIAFDLPQIANVPIIYPSGGGFAITWPLIAGDIVFLAFAERSLDAWLDAAPGLSVDPLEARKHDLSDAVAIPSMRQKTAPLAGLATPSLKIGLEDGTTLLEVTSEGQVVVSASLAILLGGASATEPFVKGATFLAHYLTHTHQVSALGAPTGPALPPPTSALLSTLIRGV